jgi:hypothetical protein
MKPKLNLDGYLYTCLRHIYLSGLSRFSREAQHFISVADFDSFELALAANRSGDPLQRPNDLFVVAAPLHPFALAAQYTLLAPWPEAPL